MATGWGRRMRVEMTKYSTNNTPASAPTTPYASLSTSLIADDGSNNGEPTSTGGYQAQPITWNTISTPSNDAAAQATNNGAINFGTGSPASGGSTLAYSTAATALAYVGVWNHITTRTEAVFLARTAVAGGGFAVNAAGITYTLPTGTGIVLGMISA